MVDILPSRRTLLLGRKEYCTGMVILGMLVISLSVVS